MPNYLDPLKVPYHTQFPLPRFLHLGAAMNYSGNSPENMFSRLSAARFELRAETEALLEPSACDKDRGRSQLLAGGVV